MMKRILIVVLCVALAMAMLTGCGNETGGEAAGATIVNETAWAFEEVYISPGEADSWGRNKGALEPGDSYGVTLEATESGYYDLEAVDEEGDYWTFLELPLEDGCSVYIWEDEANIFVDVESADGGATEVMGTLTINSGQNDAAESDVADRSMTEEPAAVAPGFYNITSEIIEDQSRVNNKVRIAYFGEWRYGTVYGQDNVNNSFVREKVADGTGGTFFYTGGIVREILIQDETTMFFTLAAADADNGLYRAAADGSNSQKLAGGEFQTVQLLNGILYFSGDATENKLMGYDVATGETSAVLDKPVFFAYVYGDQIMYQDDADGETLHICNMDGSNDTRITNSRAYYPVYDGEYLYYVDGDAGNLICRAALDGSDYQVLSGIPGAGIVLSGDQIYFRGFEDDKLHRMSKDGEYLGILAADLETSYNPFMIGGTLFFLAKKGADGSTGGLHYVDLSDGSAHLAMATVAPAPAPTPKPTSNTASQGDAYVPPDDYYYDTWDQYEWDYYNEFGGGAVSDEYYW